MLKLQTSLFLGLSATYSLKGLIKKPACLKGLENPTCIDLILTNQSKRFQNSNDFETGLSNFHKLAITVLKAYPQKQIPKVIKNKNCKKIDNNMFRNDLLNELLSKNARTKHLDSFKATTQYIFDRHAPLTLFRMGPFGSAYGWGGGCAKGPSSLKSVTHILQ